MISSCPQCVYGKTCSSCSKPCIYCGEPRGYIIEDYHIDCGLKYRPGELRDKFAIEAMKGLIGLGIGGWAVYDGRNHTDEENRKDNFKVMTQRAYEIADVMLEMRKPKEFA